MGGFPLELLVFTAILSVVCAFSKSSKENMYESIDGAAACFKRLNGTHQFGCTSDRSGNVGVIHFIQSDADFDWLLYNASAEPYIAILHPSFFNMEKMVVLKESGKVNGVLLLKNGSNDQPENFTHEDTCPNRYSGLSTFSSQTCHTDKDPWNPSGTSLLLKDWGFPIFYIHNESVISKLYKCYSKHNADNMDQQASRPLCALEMKSFMLAAVDSKTCIRRSNIISNFSPVRYCDPLGDHNVWSTQFPRSKLSPKEDNGSVIVVTARLDSTSMFDGGIAGAVSPSTGIVSLLAAASLLNSMKPTSIGRNILFVLMNGESYDYIGSSRLLWDIKNKQFPAQLESMVRDQPPPLELNHIGLFVELSQVTNFHKTKDNKTLLYYHRIKSEMAEMEREFVTEMKSRGNENNLSFTENVGNIPPSSLQTFLAEDENIPGLVLAGHGKQFDNKYYHSIYDNKEYLDYTYQNGSEPLPESIQVVIADFAFTLASSLYYMVTNKTYTGEVKRNATLVDELFYCYLESTDCPLFRAATYGQKLSTKPPALYVGVSVWSNAITSLTGQALALLTPQEIMNHTQEECHSDLQDQVFQLLWMSGSLRDSNNTGICVKTTMNYSLAISPAFEVSSYDWSSGIYSTWSESTWDQFTIRMFLKPSRGHEILTFTVGFNVLVLSFFIVYLTNKRSHILFSNGVTSNEC